MERINFIAAWAGILLGFFAGAVPGMLFHDPAWLGGYTSWARRMIRLAHISFFGLGFINLAFALSVGYAHLTARDVLIPSMLFLSGAVLMPTICYLAAWRTGFRRLFFIPVICLIAAATLFLFGVIVR